MSVREPMAASSQQSPGQGEENGEENGVSLRQGVEAAHSACTHRVGSLGALHQLPSWLSGSPISQVSPPAARCPATRPALAVNLAPSPRGVTAGARKAALAQGREGTTLLAKQTSPACVSTNTVSTNSPSRSPLSRPAWMPSMSQDSELCRANLLGI